MIKHLMATLDFSSHLFYVGVLQELACVETACKKRDMQIRFDKKSSHLLTYIIVEMMENNK